MNSDYGLRSGCNSISNKPWVNVEGFRIGLNRHRCCPTHRDSDPSSDKGVGWNNHFVPGAYADGSKNEMQSIQAVSYPNGMSNVAILSPARLKSFKLPPEHKAAAVENPSHGLE
jgi:hypothetical protein